MKIANLRRVRTHKRAESAGVMLAPPGMELGTYEVSESMGARVLVHGDLSSMFGYDLTRRPAKARAVANLPSRTKIGPAVYQTSIVQAVREAWGAVEWAIPEKPARVPKSRHGVAEAWIAYALRDGRVVAMLAPVIDVVPRRAA